MMKNLVQTLTVLLLMLGTSSCMLDGVKGNGNIVTDQRKISDDFSQIELSRGLELHLTQSSEVSLRVEADENLQDLITTEVKDGILTITSRKNIWRAGSKKIHLSVDNLSEIDASSGSEVYTANTFSGEALRLNLSSGAMAKMSLDIVDLSCDGSSGADISLSGKAVNFAVTSSSGSDIEAFELEAQNCSASASSGSDIKVHVTGEFRGAASSGSDIKFHGSPKVVNQDSNSGGSVRAVAG